MPLPTPERCRLVTGSVETTYLRLGHGPTVVIVDRSRTPDDVPSPLHLRLSRHLRLVLPIIPATAMVLGVCTWLTDFLDGLGTAPVGLLATNDHAGPLLQLALTRPWQVSRVALLASAHAWPPDATVLHDRLAGTTTPLLMLPGSHRPGPLVRVLAPYFAGRQSVPPSP